MKAGISIAVAALLSGGCATPYAPNSFWNDGGFSETEIQPGLYMVRFNGNEMSSEERTADFAMLRASELCLAKGAGFMYLGDFATKRVVSGVIPGQSTTTSNATATAYGNTAYASGSTYTTTRPPIALYSPQSGLMVRCSTQSGDGTWDATFLANSLRGKYKISVK